MEAADAVLFICYAACRLHPGFVYRDVAGADCVDSDWEDALCAMVAESVMQRRNIPALIADRLESAVGLSRAEIFRIATAACAYLDNLQLNDYIDGICSYEYISIKLAAEVMQGINLGMGGVKVSTHVCDTCSKGSSPFLYPKDLPV